MFLGVGARLRVPITTRLSLSPVRKQKTQLRVADNDLSNNDIRDYVFSGCRKLTAVTLPSSLTNISNSAFDDHVKLVREGEGDSDNIDVMDEAPAMTSSHHGEGDSDNIDVMDEAPAMASSHPDDDESESAKCGCCVML